MTPVGIGSHHPQLGLVLPSTTLGERPVIDGITQGTTGTAGELATLCRQAESVGADSLWAVDHLFWPHPIDEPLTTLAVAAAVTSHVTLGTCVLQLPLRSPAAVAKQATSLQRLSGGRFVLGLGVGSHGEEYRRAGIDFNRRGSLMDDAVTALRRFWDPVGSSDSAPAYVQEPRSPRIPLWFGGHSPGAIRRAGRLGDAWIPLFVTPDDYASGLRSLRRVAASAGRNPDAVGAGVVVFARVGDDHEAGERGASWLSDLYHLPPKAFRRHLVAGTPESCAAQLHSYGDAGARHIVVMMAGPSAVDHFSLIRAAFVSSRRPVLTGARS